MVEQQFGQFTVVLRRCLAEMLLDVNDFLELVKLTNDLQHRDAMPVVNIGAVMHPNTGVGAGELASAGNPIDRRSLIKEICGLKAFDPIPLDHLDAKHLALFVIFDQLGRQHLNDHISKLFLGIDVGFEVWTTGINRRQNVLVGMSPLRHIALNLPGNLYLIANIEVNAEIKKATDTLIVERMQPFNHDDVIRLNTFWWIN